jgi:hypothetical protein
MLPSRSRRMPLIQLRRSRNTPQFRQHLLALRQRGVGDMHGNGECGTCTAMPVIALTRGGTRRSKGHEVRDRHCTSWREGAAWDRCQSYLIALRNIQTITPSRPPRVTQSQFPANFQHNCRQCLSLTVCLSLFPTTPSNTSGPDIWLCWWQIGTRAGCARQSSEPIAG